MKNRTPNPALRVNPVTTAESRRGIMKCRRRGHQPQSLSVPVRRSAFHPQFRVVAEVTMLLQNRAGLTRRTTWRWFLASVAGVLALAVFLGGFGVRAEAPARDADAARKDDGKKPDVKKADAPAADPLPDEPKKP